MILCFGDLWHAQDHKNVKVSRTLRQIMAELFVCLFVPILELSISDYSAAFCESCIQTRTSGRNQLGDAAEVYLSSGSPSSPDASRRLHSHGLGGPMWANRSNSFKQQGFLTDSSTCFLLDDISDRKTREGGNYHWLASFLICSVFGCAVVVQHCCSCSWHEQRRACRVIKTRDISAGSGLCWWKGAFLLLCKCKLPLHFKDLSHWL